MSTSPDYTEFDTDPQSVDSSVHDRAPAVTAHTVRPLIATEATPRRPPQVRESGWWVLAPAFAGIVTGLVLNFAQANALYVFGGVLLLCVLGQLLWSRARYLRRIKRAIQVEKVGKK